MEKIVRNVKISNTKTSDAVHIELIPADGVFEKASVGYMAGEQRLKMCLSPKVVNVIEETTSILEDFDYAVIRYIWTGEGGVDLDSRTQIVEPAQETIVGWNHAISDGRYITWGRDNVQDGVECVMVDMKLLVDDYPDHIGLYALGCRAFWYKNRVSGDMVIQFQTYKGGVMKADGYDFINEGGVTVQKIDMDCSLMTTISADIPGQLLGYLRYDADLRKGYLVNVTQGPYVPLTVTQDPVTYDVHVTGNPDTAFHIYFKDNDSVNPNNTFYIDETGNVKLSLDDIFANLNSSRKDGVVVTFLTQHKAAEDVDFILSVPEPSSLSSYNIFDRKSYIYAPDNSQVEIIDSSDVVVKTITLGSITYPVIAHTIHMDESNLTPGDKFKFRVIQTLSNGNVITSMIDDPSMIYTVIDSSYFTSFFTRPIWYIAYQNDGPAVTVKMTNVDIIARSKSGDYYTLRKDTTSEQTVFYFLSYGWSQINRPVEIEFVIVRNGVPIPPCEHKFYKASGFSQIGENVTKLTNQDGTPRWFMDTYETPAQIPRSLTSLKGFFADYATERKTEVYDIIVNWDVSNITDFSQAFSYAKTFNHNISGWNMINAENVEGMFEATPLFNQPIGNWVMPKVRSYYNFLNGATEFNQPINYDMSNVYNLSAMFANTSAFNQPLSHLRVGNVENMNYMFRFATAFDQDLSMWCVSNAFVGMQHVGFNPNRLETQPEKLPKWGSCPLGY